MKVSLIQTTIDWEDIDTNLEKLTSILNSIETTDIIVLPEMFTTGFTLNVKKLAEPMHGKTMSWLQGQAKLKNALLIGSIIIIENDKYFNRCLCVFPDGKYEYYDKKHLFSYGHEDDVFSSGNKPLIISYKGFRIKPLICYDLRFPVWSRNIENYDLLIYIASWPSSRISAWNQLLVARAIENQCYVIGVNRLGIDGNKLLYNGNSAIIEYSGSVIHHDDKENVLQYSLDKDALKSFRNQFPFLNDKDQFTIK